MDGIWTNFKVKITSLIDFKTLIKLKRTFNTVILNVTFLCHISRQSWYLQ